MSDRRTIDRDRLCADVEAAAELAGVRCLREITRDVIRAYERFFTTSAVSFRTTTRAPAHRGLNVRYVELEAPHDPWAIALAEGFLARSGDPIDDLLAEIRRSCAILGYGVDVGVTYGLEKIWPFFPQRPLPLARLDALPSLPPAARALAPTLARHGLDRLSLFALDYRSRTVNLYFMRRPGQSTPAQLAALIAELGFPPLGDELLVHAAQATPVYVTFDWGSPRALRLCFGIIAPDARAVPASLHPLIARYAANAPFSPVAGERRGFIYGVTLGRDEAFFKIENDYTGTMTALMRVF